MYGPLRRNIPRRENIIPAENLPCHWQLLTESALGEYLDLRDNCCSSTSKSLKGERLDEFIGRLAAIKRFVEADVIEGWRRCLVCGIFFLPNGLAINIQQLRIVLGKCKSSINGSLHQLGYITQPPGSQLERELSQLVPLCRSEHAELKKWTLRVTTQDSILHKKPFPPPPLPVPVVKTHQYYGEDPIEPPYPVLLCPIKLRERFYKLLYSSTGVQTDSC